MQIALLAAGINAYIETCEDEKCYKNLLKTRPSLMIIYSKTGTSLYGFTHIHSIFRSL
jgi:hypothetical protein